MRHAPINVYKLKHTIWQKRLQALIQYNIIKDSYSFPVKKLWWCTSNHTCCGVVYP